MSEEDRLPFLCDRYAREPERTKRAAATKREPEKRAREPTAAKAQRDGPGRRRTSRRKRREPRFLGGLATMYRVARRCGDGAAIVWSFLAAHAKRRGPLVSVGFVEIAEAVGATERSVRARMKRLRAAGFVSIEREGRSFPRRLGPEYRLHADAATEPSAATAREGDAAASE